MLTVYCGFRLAPPRAEVDASVAVDEAFGVEQSLEEALSDILSEAGIESPHPDDGTIGAYVGNVAFDTESKPPDSVPVPLTQLQSPRTRSAKLMRRLQAARDEDASAASVPALLFAFGLPGGRRTPKLDY